MRVAARKLDLVAQGRTRITTEHPQLQSQEWLRREFVSRQRSAPAIAAELGVSDSSVYRAIHDLGLPTRSTHEMNEIFAGS